jgi:hypothetical protein
LTSIRFINYCRLCGSEDVQISQSVLAPFFAFRLLGWTPFEILPGRFRDLAPGKSYFPARTTHCRFCRNVSLGMIFSDDSMERYYTDYQGEKFISSRKELEPSFRGRMERRENKNILRIRGERVSYIEAIEEYIIENIGTPLPDRLLDIGGGTGSNTLFKGRIEFDITDIDSDLDLQKPKLQKYALVSIMNVLEHLLDPVATLRLAKSFLDTDSKSFIVIEVPLEGFMFRSLSIDTGPEKNPEQDFANEKIIWTEHINCFSPYGLSKVARLVGLSPLAPFLQLDTTEGGGGGGSNGAISEKSTALVGLFGIA